MPAVSEIGCRHHHRVVSAAVRLGRAAVGSQRALRAEINGISDRAHRVITEDEMNSLRIGTFEAGGFAEIVLRVHDPTADVLSSRRARLIQGDRERAHGVVR